MPEPTDTASVSALLLQAKRQEIEAARALAGRAELVDVIGQLIHALQRERGASTIFLASEGRRFAEVREHAAAEAEAVQQRLGMLFAAHAPAPASGPRLLAAMAWVLLGLQSLPSLRAQIGQRQVGAPEAIAEFSRLIAGLVELVSLVADAALLPGISRLLVALLHLVQGKEAAGQERAVGALLYAGGRCIEAEQQRLLQLIDAQEASLRVFAEFADPAVRARWEAQQLAPVVARLERLRRALGTARPGSALDPAQSDAWFETCSERIGELWQLQLALVDGLRRACEDEIRDAERQLEDSAGLLERLREHPPAAAPAAGAESATLQGLLQAQAERLAAMETELEAARRALQERKVVERAKGVLMSRLRMSEDEAFRALQKTSMDQNRRLVDVAEATLALPDFVFERLAPPAP